MEKKSEKWDKFFYDQRMKEGNNNSLVVLQFENQCDIVAAMENLEMEIYQLHRRLRYKSPLIKFEDESPPNDYNYECYLVGKDGFESPSDGGTIHDIHKTTGILGWRKIIG